MKIEAVIFDFGRTLYDPEADSMFPHAVETLEALKERGLKLGLVTVAEIDYTKWREDQLKELNLNQFFQAIVIVARSTKGKDFTDVLSQLGLENDPQKCVIVGDNLKREITAGNSISAYTVWTRQRLSADWKPQNEIQTPQATINNIEELVPIIDKLNNSTVV